MIAIAIQRQQKETLSQDEYKRLIEKCRATDERYIPLFLGSR